jgi:hypothetical protein
MSSLEISTPFNPINSFEFKFFSKKIIFSIFRRVSLSNFVIKKLNKILISYNPILEKQIVSIQELNTNQASNLYDRVKKNIFRFTAIYEDLEEFNFLNNDELKLNLQNTLDLFYKIEALTKKELKKTLTPTDSYLKKDMSECSKKYIAPKLT